MTAYVALLRAVNVGGTGKLNMKELTALCAKAGFEDPRTYIQSGNVVFGSRLAEAAVKAELERALSGKLKKPAMVLVRTANELEHALTHNPFRNQPPKFTQILFLDQALPPTALAEIRTPGGEQLDSKGREVFIHYPQGQGKSKLLLPFAAAATGRNLNTVEKLLAMARERETRP